MILIEIQLEGIKIKTRIVTVCIEGKPVEKVKENKEREDILKKVAEKIVAEKWPKIDAIVFPGGFFYLDEYVGHLSFKKRAKILSETSFHKTCMAMFKENLKGSFIIVGVDSNCPRKPKIKKELGDQFCVAWNRRGIIGIGRKIFPVNGYENKHYVCYKNDFSTKYRIIKFGNGKNIILCACYDMFGVAESGTKKDAILFIEDSKSTLHKKGEDKFENIIKSCVEGLNKIIGRKKVVSGIVAIHDFRSHGDGSGKVMWQRHGIASCSSRLGNFAIGASHFENLPMSSISTLASNKVPKNHLNKGQGHKRKSKEVLPEDSFKLNEGKILVRLFEFNS